MAVSVVLMCLKGGRGGEVNSVVDAVPYCGFEMRVVSAGWKYMHGVSIACTKVQGQQRYLENAIESGNVASSCLFVV